jgi:Ser/Thr protein kinase RdoA (MazF antagonist)
LSAPRDDGTPFDGLTPAVVLDALDAVGLRGDGRVLQLNSYENRVFQVFLEDGRVVVPKFYRPGRWSDAQILEEHAFALELALAEVPAVAPLSLVPDAGAPVEARVSALPEGALDGLWDEDDEDRPGATLAHVEIDGHAWRFSVSPRRAGPGPDLDDTDTLTWIGRFIGRLHAVGKRRPFEHRRRLDVATLGQASVDWLAANDALPPEVATRWHDTATTALAAVREAFDACAGLPSIRLHGDCHPGNVLWTAQGPHFVDLDDAMNGPAIQDLWMLLSGDRHAMAAQLHAVRAGYEDFAALDPRAIALIEPLRTLRMVHHSAWLAQRWRDPAFPVAFPFFEGAAYWSQQVIQLREQLEAMAEAPLA